MSNPLVSVTIASKNEEKNIGHCLESLKKQSYLKKAIEIIVVDNNSTDRTKDIALEYTSLVYNKGPERAAQRNYGMLEKSKGKYLVFLDADMSLSQNLLEKAVEKLEKSESSALYIPERVTGNSYQSKVRNFERSFYNGTSIDCVRIIRADVFKKINGFDESLTGPEDWDLDKRIRQVGKVAILGDVCLYHNESNFNLKKYLSKKSYYSQTCQKYIEKWGKNDADIKKQFGFKYRFLTVFLEKGKWRKMLFNPHLAIGMYFLRLLVGATYLKRGKEL